jgi:hypothetical protein
MILGSGIRDPGSGIRKKPIPDSGSRGQKAPNPGSRIRIRNTAKLKQKYRTAEKNCRFWSKIAVYLSLGLLKGRSNYRRSLQPSKENIWHLKK